MLPPTLFSAPRWSTTFLILELPLQCTRRLKSFLLVCKSRRAQSVLGNCLLRFQLKLRFFLHFTTLLRIKCLLVWLHIHSIENKFREQKSLLSEFETWTKSQFSCCGKWHFSLTRNAKRRPESNFWSLEPEPKP